MILTIALTVVCICLQFYCFSLSRRVDELWKQLVTLKREMAAIKHNSVDINPLNEQLKIAFEDITDCRNQYTTAQVEWSKMGKAIGILNYREDVIIRDLKDLEKYTYPNGRKPVEITECKN